MAREGGGGGGAFGWTILGVIIGVAGTLAVQTLIGTHRANEAEQAPTSAAVAVVMPPAPPPPPPPAAHSAASAAPVMASEASSPSREDVEDDAAAAGMTSRSHTGDADRGSSAPN